MNKLPLKIFRGDKRKHGTFAELYRTEGLLSKEIHGGNPAYVNLNGLFKSVRAHVKPNNVSEQMFHEKTKFISFTSNYDRAKYYASDGHTPKLLPCKEYYEQRYIFTLDMVSAIPLAKSKGLYKIEFLCNRKLIKPNSPDDWPLLLLQNFPCKQCETSKFPHCIILIDVATFLSENAQYENCDNALKLARSDHEWLVMPADYSLELRGLSSRIPRANIWNAEHFILSDEVKRNPSEDAVPGMIFDSYS